MRRMTSRSFKQIERRHPSSNQRDSGPARSDLRMVVRLPAETGGAFFGLGGAGETKAEHVFVGEEEPLFLGGVDEKVLVLHIQLRDAGNGQDVAGGANVEGGF